MDCKSVSTLIIGVPVKCFVMCKPVCFASQQVFAKLKIVSITALLLIPNLYNVMSCWLWHCCAKYKYVHSSLSLSNYVTTLIPLLFQLQNFHCIQETHLLKEKLLDGHIAVHIDFPENYRHRSQEIKTANFNITQVTLQPIAMYYKHEHSLIPYRIVSDDPRHDAKFLIFTTRRLFNFKVSKQEDIQNNL